MANQELKTVRLRLIPYAPAYLLSLIEGVRQFETATGFRTAEGLRDFVVSPDVSPAWMSALRGAVDPTKPDPWIYGFAVVEQETGLVVGHAGFKGEPDGEGVAEIAYAIVPARENRGYATEAARALAGFAAADGRVRVVRAHTLPAENASTLVLTKCGFHRVGEIVDTDDGPVWRWELIRS